MSFAPALALADLPLGTVQGVRVGEEYVVLAHVDEGVYALRDECSHASILLSEGDLVDCTLECFAHGSRFDLRTGLPLNPPATRPVPAYPVRVLDGMVHVDIDEPLDPYLTPSVPSQRTDQES